MQFWKGLSKQRQPAAELTAAQRAVGEARERGNTIEVPAELLLRTDVVFNFEGVGNVLTIGANFHNYRYLRFDFPSHGGRCDIGANCYIGSGILRVCNASTATFGDGFTATKGLGLEVAEGASIIFEPDVMLGTDIIVRASDGHPIFDADTGERVNVTRPISVGEHVWIGDRAVILGGTAIGSGSVVGAGSLVKGIIPANSLAVGTPAKAIRDNIVWSRKGLKRVRPGTMIHSSSLTGEFAIR